MQDVHANVGGSRKRGAPEDDTESDTEHLGARKKRKQDHNQHQQPPPSGAAAAAAAGGAGAAAAGGRRRRARREYERKWERVGGRLQRIGPQ
ncbi:unnamed protein product [Vitrella brassicaformis CCMP3155]|uniref:Uncharacterized protein n=1 Tax=Vitrella brassicaformis (strain CCMP3155) TaxID=1169540 RepID=A0A0G4GQE3_VITBC|nr:unnamed protein product [Vitrella brassicaformis CCMP3155]|eukprot:CEM32673.1 unnamed protein product [Vitrella brassicaformis CCMP3155]